MIFVEERGYVHVGSVIGPSDPRCKKCEGTGKADTKASKIICKLSAYIIEYAGERDYYSKFYEDIESEEVYKD